MNYNTAFGNYVKILNAVFLCKKILFQLSLYVLGQKRARKWKNHAVGVRREKANKKTHLESLLRSPRAETGRGSREVSWKTRGVEVEKQERKDKKENKQKFTPETDEKGFRGELIYNKKASWILIKLKST